MKYLFILLLLAQPLAARTFSVTHEKSLWRDSRGTIDITDEGIRYISEKEKESRFWLYRDIQHFDRISNTEFTILSYEDEARYLGRDKSYHFVITEGEITDDFFRTINRRIGTPVTNRALPEITGVEYEIPVKHTHTFGGCEGTLLFTKDSIYYKTDRKKDAREWMLGRDIQSVWSSDPYQLEIHVYENNRREFSKTRIYNYQLKEPLDQEMYHILKLRLYELN